MDSKKGKATLINLIGYEKTLIFANKIKRQLEKKIKRLGSKSEDLLESVAFLLDRDF